MKSRLSKNILLLSLVVMLGLSDPYQAFADDGTAAIEKRLDDLEQQVADLKQELWKKKQVVYPRQIARPSKRAARPGIAA